MIDHVVVLALENRSFDHMLGFLDHPSPAFDGLRAGPHTNPGWDGEPEVAATAAARPVLPVGPDHSHDAVMEQLALRGPRRTPTNSGFVINLERTGRGLDPPVYGGLAGPVRNWLASRNASSSAGAVGRGPLAMLCQPAAQVPALSRLAMEFAVCTRWFCSVPGETWPNRNFLHAATSAGETNIALRFYTDRTIFELLEEHGKSWHIYHDDTPQVWAFSKLWDEVDRHANWFPLTAFAEHVASGALPTYSFLEPNHRPPLHSPDHDPLIGTPDVSDNQHPENNLVSDAAYASSTPVDTDFARGDALIAAVYEALRANPSIFERTVLLITYDEHGGLYDHVPPPTDVPSPGTRVGWGTRLAHLLLHRQTAAFDFTMLGPRVPAVIVSPHIAAGTVDATVRDHASVPATLRMLFAPQAAPLTKRDAWAAPFHTAMTLDEPRRGEQLPDLSAHTGPALASALGGAGTASPSPTVSPQGASSDAAAPMPHFYKAFVAQADEVHAHLAGLGEHETRAPLPADPRARALEVSRRFAAAATRHRDDREPPPVG